MKIFTIGYEGLDLDAFLQLLHANDIEMLVDVRQLPLSRKPGFSKRALAHLLGEADIEYVHIPALGCPKPIRDRYRKDNDWKGYKAHFLKHLATQEAALNDLAELSLNSNCALMCFEADYNFCHRSMVADAVHQLSGADVEHIASRQNATNFSSSSVPDQFAVALPHRVSAET